MDNFEAIRDHLLGHYRVTDNEPFLVCVELSLDNGRRHQSIFLSELEDEDGRKFLRVSTAVGALELLEPRKALEFNWKSQVGYLACSELGGKPFLHLCENRPYQHLSPTEVDRLVLEIGGLGDRIERMLTPDADDL